MEIINIVSVDGKIEQYIVEKKIIDVEELKAERAALIAQKEAEKPSDQELIEWARMAHPYFSEQISLDLKIQNLTNIINDLQNID